MIKMTMENLNWRSKTKRMLIILSTSKWEHMPPPPRSARQTSISVIVRLQSASLNDYTSTRMKSSVNKTITKLQGRYFSLVVIKIWTFNQHYEWTSQCHERSKLIFSHFLLFTLKIKLHSGSHNYSGAITGRKQQTRNFYVNLKIEHHSFFFFSLAVMNNSEHWWSKEQEWIFNVSERRDLSAAEDQLLMVL